jgi:hypothetical protein
MSEKVFWEVCALKRSLSLKKKETRETQEVQETQEAQTRLWKSGLDMLYLANCALRDVTPDKSVMDALSLEDVARMAKKQSMDALTYYGVEKYLSQLEGQALKANEDLLKQWKQIRDMAIRKNIMLDLAREQIQEYMEKNGIWYMPLKGSLIKDMYPKPGMRQMSDNDILIDRSYRKQIFDYMIDLGYTGHYHENRPHDEYLKKPFYNFEIHTSLIAEDTPVFGAYYQNVKEKLVQENGCRYRFRDEDFYIYMMAHAYKHYSNAGNGVRHFMDVFVYLENKPNLDRGYIETELDRLGILNYESAVKELSETLFDPACRSPKEIEAVLDENNRTLLGFCIGAGTYGSLKNLVKKRLQNLTKGEKLTTSRGIRYFWNRFFCLDGLYSDFPKLAKYRCLRPFLYVGRALKILFSSSRCKTLCCEAKTITDMINSKNNGNNTVSE